MTAEDDELLDDELLEEELLDEELLDDEALTLALDEALLLEAGVVAVWLLPPPPHALIAMLVTAIVPAKRRVLALGVNNEDVFIARFRPCLS